jgi:uncharacterized protein YybS (DUF2232 family)
LTAELPAVRSRHAWLLAGVLPLLAYLAYLQPGGDMAGLISLGVGVAVFFLTAGAYYAVARLALESQRMLLLISGGSALIIASLMTGLSGMWIVFMGIVIILAGGIMTGRLTVRQWSSSRIYILGALMVATLFTAQYGAVWPDLIAAAGTASETALTELERMMASFGYGEQQITDNSLAMRRMFDFVVGLMPAFTVLSSLLQFSLGFLLFGWWLGRSRPELSLAMDFDYWRVPFGATPVLLLAIALHAVGGEALKLVGSNVLVILAVYYGVTGLALIEYYLKRLGLSLGMKIMFYLLLFLTQMVGFMMAAILGFLDSFFDWRLRTEMRAEAEA